MFSVFMLVSRSNKLAQKAIASVAKQEPDEFRAYIDYDKVEPNQRVFTWLKNAGADIREQIKNPTFSSLQNWKWNLHRGFLESKYTWTCKVDDDDEIKGRNRNEILHGLGTKIVGVGIIHGDKMVKQGLVTQKHQSAQINSWQELANKRIFTGTAIVNRDAFKQVHPLVDHGYFADWKIFYWILRAKWESFYLPETLLFQNANPHPTQERLKLYGTWGNVMAKLNGVPDELVEYCNNINCSDWRFHLSFVK